MKKTFLTLFCLSLLALSCKKDKTASAAEQPYSNLNAGSNWRYQVITNPGPTQTSVNDTVTVTGGDTTISSKIYKILNHSNGNTRSYYNVTGNDYYQFQTLAALNVDIDALYLKDNIAVGGNWSQSINVTLGGFPVPIVLTSTILEKGVSKVVSGITYNDVITVKTDLSSTALPGGIVSDIKNYYARNIGLIQGDYNIDVAVASVAVHSQTLLLFADPR